MIFFIAFYSSRENGDGGYFYQNVMWPQSHRAGSPGAGITKIAFVSFVRFVFT